MIFRPKGKGGDLSHRSSHTLAYGEIYDGAGEVLDEVVVSLFGHRILIRAKIR